MGFLGIFLDNDWNYDDHGFTQMCLLAQSGVGSWKARKMRKKMYVKFGVEFGGGNMLGGCNERGISPAIFVEKSIAEDPEGRSSEILMGY